MDNVSHVPQSETAERCVGSSKPRRGRSDKDCARDENVVQELAAVDTAAVQAIAAKTVSVEAVDDKTVTRESSLLLATLRVWELKQGISE